MSLISNNSFREDDKKKQMRTEDMKGEESVSGSMPSPDADDDVLEFEHESGLYLKEDEENPKEADIGDEVNSAEREHQQD